MKNLNLLATIAVLSFVFAVGVRTADAGIIVNDRSISTTPSSCMEPKEKTELETIKSIVGIIVNGLTGIIVNDINNTGDVNCGIIVND